MTRKVQFSAAAVPQFANLKYFHELALPNIGRDRPCKPSGELLAFSLRAVLADQFDDGVEMGAWSRKYSQYIHFLYGDTLPGDVSTKDTITFSAIIAEHLVRFSTLPLPEHLHVVIQNRLQHLEAYLLSRPR